jgi:AcrR family transcriptional regulator
MFLERGYPSTKMGDIAAQAGVALDTVYASFGAKLKLFQMLLETAISGADRPIPFARRPRVRAFKAERDPVRKVEIYATEVSEIRERLAPLVSVLQPAASTHRDLAALWRRISDRRARRTRTVVAGLAATGAMRRDLPRGEAADIAWAMNSPEVYQLLVNQRGWSPARYRRWLAAASRRFLLGA